MDAANIVPENLRAAIQALDTLEHVSVLQDWVWNEKKQRWVLHCRLTPPVQSGGPIPAETDWFVTATSDYPSGAIKFLPAKSNGLTQTFPHQSYNGEGAKEQPWRSGDLCLNTSVHVLDRPGLDTEPTDAYYRLWWHFGRAAAWLIAASKGELLRPGEPYELPPLPFRAGDKILLAFSEKQGLEAWAGVTQRVGFAEMGQILGQSKSVFVKSFKTLQGQELYSPSWGQVFSKAEVAHTGIWIRLDQFPLLPIWRGPRTWGELRAAMHSQGTNLDALLQQTLHHLRDGKIHLILLGFPIPDIQGDQPVQMQWIAVELPVLSRGTRTADGFRTNETGYWMRDRRQLLCDECLLQWQLTENWTEHQLLSRGSLPQDVSQHSVALIGGGALGSVLAELLVRAGSYRMTIIDPETLAAGNLVRHTLGLNELRTSKAESLAVRLNRVSPHADVHGAHASFPGIDEQTAARLESADVVIECTGDDETLQALQRFRWRRKRRFFSFSLGMRARRLFCFSETSKQFSASSFQERMRPWLEREGAEHAGDDFPREGVGCWHPVFPARVDDVQMMATAGVKYLERTLLSQNGGADLTVYEQEFDNDGWAGLRKATEPGQN